MKPFKIFGKNFEKSALDQFHDAMEQPFVVRGALMPDAHMGYSLPIGAVVATDNFVLPSWVGYDIGCGMCAMPTTASASEVRENAERIFADIYKIIPVGFRHNARALLPENEMPPMTVEMEAVFEQKQGYVQLGTLGGGNHFIEIGEESDGTVWIIIHSGSRGIGHGCASHYMRAASPTGKASEGHFGFGADSEMGQKYITDMNFCLAFALENRRAIMSRTLGAMGLSVHAEGVWDDLINRNHNHADFKDGMWIHRKGATHAEHGMMGVIPGNMRDGSFIVRGLGEEDSLWSSSHGAGRVMGRKAAKQTLSLDEFKETMSGVVALVEQETLDEAPFAYKNIFDVMEAQELLVDVVAHVKPILNIKG